MCGVAGFSGVSHLTRYQRMALVDHLGMGIQTRGNHAWGWIGGDNGGVQTGKGLGRWSATSIGTTWKVAEYDSVIMHSRYATHGSKDDVRNAHPFCIRRNNRTVLYGVHNGVLHGTEATAKKYGRDHTVDSRELLELMADGKHEDIATISGYGLLAWTTPRSRVIQLCKLTAGANIAVFRVKRGGIVFASESSMVRKALDAAGLDAGPQLYLEKVGATYMLWNGILSLNAKAEPILLESRPVSESYDYPGAVPPAYAGFSARVREYQAKKSASQSAGTVEAMFRSYYERAKDGTWWQVYHDGYRCRMTTTPTWSTEYKAWEAKAMASVRAAAIDAKDGPDTVRDPWAEPEVCDHNVSLDAECYQCEAFGGDTTVNEEQVTG